MKKLFMVFIAALSFATGKVRAQCTVSNLAVEVNSITPGVGNSCTINFDLTWVQEVNNGNKFAYVHLWNGNYHTPAPNWVGMYVNPPDYPVAADLANSLLTICIEDNGTATPFIGSKYYPDETITEFTATTVVKSPIDALTERMTLQNISLTFGNCSIPINLQGDIWASQAANGKNVHCVSQGLNFVINDPRVTGFMKCTNPRMFNLSITTTSVSDVNVFFKIYKDDGDGLYEPGTQDILVGTSAAFDVSASNPFAGADIGYTGNNIPGENGPLWIEVLKTAGGTFSTVAFLASPGCAPLPVDFKSFTAVRNGSNVNLRWETITEQNSTGFAVERNINGSWQQIGFVTSQAAGGSSNSLLTYHHSDINTSKGISQYRVRQVDFDNRSKFSEIRSVIGDGQKMKTIIYPNPTFDGKVNVVFEDAKGTRDVSLMDASGRIVKQWKGITSNNIQIDNLVPGMYSLRIVIRETGEQSAEKIIVNNR